jgi:hypothetical protein
MTKAKTDDAVQTTIQKSTKLASEVSLMCSDLPTFWVIGDKVQADIVGGYLTRIKVKRNEIEEWFAPIRDAAYATWKAIVARQKEIEARPIEIETICKGMIDAWGKAEKARVAAEQSRLDAEERERQRQKAVDEGDTRTAKAIENGKLAVVSNEVAAPAAIKIAGVSMKTTWTGDVTDPMGLIRAVAAGRCSPEYVMPNMVTINAVIRSTKGKITIPGVTVREQSSVVSRA